MIDIEQRPTPEELTHELETADLPSEKDIPAIRRKIGKAVRAIEKHIPMRRDPPVYRSHTISDGLLVPFPGSPPSEMDDDDD